MSVPKGRRVGGRKPGTPNKKTVLRQQTLKALCPDGSDPMTFWLQVLKDKSVPYEIRERAARDLAPYVHPKLASIEARTGGKTHEQRLEELQRMARDEDDPT